MFNTALKSQLLRKFFTTNILRCYSSGILTKTSFENGVQTITMSDAKTRNSLSMPMMEDLIVNVKKYEADVNLRVIVITAEGPVFSAGHNMKELLPEMGRQQHEKVFNKCAELMMSIIESPVPIIAKIDGVAAAAGCQLVAQCDMAVCTDISKFSTPGANFGIFCSTPGIPIARSVQKMTALRMLFTGLPITAQEAKESGLISLICTKDNIDKEMNTITSAITNKSRSVIELGKKFYYKQIQHGIKEAYSLGSATMVSNIGLKDGQEGIKGFVEKRKPEWTHSFE